MVPLVIYMQNIQLLAAVFFSSLNILITKTVFVNKYLCYILERTSQGIRKCKLRLPSFLFYLSRPTDHCNRYLQYKDYSKTNSCVSLPITRVTPPSTGGRPHILRIIKLLYASLVDRTIQKWLNYIVRMLKIQILKRKRKLFKPKVGKHQPFALFTSKAHWVAIPVVCSKGFPGFISHSS